MSRTRIYLEPHHVRFEDGRRIALDDVDSLRVIRSAHFLKSGLRYRCHLNVINPQGGCERLRIFKYQEFYADGQRVPYSVFVRMLIARLSEHTLLWQGENIQKLVNRSLSTLGIYLITALIIALLLVGPSVFQNPFTVWLFVLSLLLLMARIGVVVMVQKERPLSLPVSPALLGSRDD